MDGSASAMAGYRQFAKLGQILWRTRLRKHGEQDGPLSRGIFQIVREISACFRMDGTFFCSIQRIPVDWLGRSIGSYMTIHLPTQWRAMHRIG